MIKAIEYNVNIWKEGNVFVAHIPQLDVASCGETIEQARINVDTALELFLEGADKQGSLDEILKEAGFASSDDTWEAPVISHERKKHMRT